MLLKYIIIIILYISYIFQTNIKFSIMRNIYAKQHITKLKNKKINFIYIKTYFFSSSSLLSITQKNFQSNRLKKKKLNNDTKLK